MKVDEQHYPSRTCKIFVNLQQITCTQVQWHIILLLQHTELISKADESIK